MKGAVQPEKAAAPKYLPLFPYLEAQKHACLLAPGELLIDNFAGVGGASLGIRWATGRPVDWAVNHNPTAVDLHRVNEPHTHHAIEDVWQVHPREITSGQPVALAWFSPTCTHFSKAKGAALLDRGIRGLAWVAVRWAALVRPRVIVLENVEEFRTWGPLTREGRPDPRQKGRTFNSFVNALRYHGYAVEWRELRACDYGTPTIRKRLFLVARCDGLPIVWPEPTHAAPTDPRVQAGLLKPFRTAAECIDWTLPCPTIFDRKKPLVQATLNRVAQGMRRFVLEAEKPFIVTCNHSGDGFRGQDVDEPFKTITAAHEAHGLIEPLLTPVMLNKQHQAPARAVGTPLSTVTTNHNKNELLAGFLVQYQGQKHGREVRGQNGRKPLNVQPTENRYAATVAHLIKFNAGSVGQDMNRPITTVMAGGQPARSSTGNPHGLVSGCLIKTDNQRSWGSCTYSLTSTTPTTVTKNNQAVVVAHLMQDVSGRTLPQDAVYSAERPARVVAAQGCRQNVVTAYLNVYERNEKDLGQQVDGGLRTIPTRDRYSLTLGTLMRQFGASTAQPAGAPLGTVVAQSNKTGAIQAQAVPTLSAEQVRRAQQVHALLAEFLTPEQLAPYSRNGLVVLCIEGVEYILADIGLRMLTPRELARCQGFPDDFVLEHTAEGKKVSKAAQVRGIGNSVCPQMAEVLTRAQLSAAREEAAD